MSSSSPSPAVRAYPWLVVGVGLALIGVLLALPSPARPVRGPASGPASAPAALVPSGPTLGSVWPAARAVPIPGMLADGSAYTPVLVLDASTSVGRALSADGLHTMLVVVAGTGSRVVQSALVREGGLFDGITVAADRLYWMRTQEDAGQVTVSLWSAALSGGPAAQLSADVGVPVFYGSQYSMQAVGGRLYWAAVTTPGQVDRTQVCSIALTGGPVTRREVAGAWTLSAWPWLVTSPAVPDGPVALYDLATNRSTPVNLPADGTVSCSPQWCRVDNRDPVLGTGIDLVHPDGSGRRRIAGGDATEVTVDVVLRDRFELVLDAAGTSGTLTMLRIYDLARGQAVLLDPTARGANGRDGFVWWATGDQETLTWHALDLRMLT
jgi:hypothetical protein